MQRGEEAKSVSEIAAISRHSEGNSNFIPKNLMTSNQLLDLSLIAKDDENIFSETGKSIQPYPSPEFLNSLSFIKKFHPVLNLLHAPRVPQMQRGCSLLHLLAIRTRCTPSVRKFALPVGAREKFTKVIHENSSNSRHSERQRKNPAYYCNTIKLKGIHMKNFFETDHASMPLGIFASKSVSAKKSAFTLAEVLITLGIIGVVAAVT